MNKQKRELIFIVGVAKGDKRWILQAVHKESDFKLSFLAKSIRGSAER